VAPEVTVRVREIQILGSTVFSEAELAAVVAPYIGKAATFEDLIAIRAAITDYYTQRGYLTSGAFLPPQDASNGIVKIQVVEGELEAIEIQGLRRLREAYVRRRLEIATQPPLNVRQLEDALQRLQLDPLLQSVQAELATGTAQGQSILKVNLREAPHWIVNLSVDNGDSPSVGSIRGSATLGSRNLLGFGDRFTATYGRTQGIQEYTLGYTVPLNPRNGTFSIFYNRNTSEIVEQPFAANDINSKAESLTIGVRQPILQTATQEVALGLALDLRRSQTFLFGDQPFSFSEGPEEGRSRVTVLRLSQEWVNRSPSRVFAARSQFSIGLNAFDATINDSGTDGRFVSWVGQLQWVQSLGDVLAIARVSGQITGDSLLPIEQFSIGGSETVRGYRQNERVGDSGILGSLELRVPVLRKPDGIGTIELAPFFDVGRVWDNNGIALSPATLMSVGVGLRWQSRWFDAQLSWGYPLRKTPGSGDSLQDKGLFFSFTLSPF
jgi:hemolysin activation/secretion protein